MICLQIEAEKLILAANGERGLAVVALRPSGIFGEWDRLFVPTLVDKAKQGKMKYILGDGNNLMEWTYAGNVADAHLLVSFFYDAENRLTLLWKAQRTDLNCRYGSLLKPRLMQQGPTQSLAKAAVSVQLCL